MNQTVDFVNASDFFEAIELGGAESVEFLLERSTHRIVSQFIHVVADDIDWEFLYNDSMTIKAHQ